MRIRCVELKQKEICFSAKTVFHSRKLDEKVVLTISICRMSFYSHHAIYVLSELYHVSFLFSVIAAPRRRRKTFMLTEHEPSPRLNVEFVSIYCYATGTSALRTGG